MAPTRFLFWNINGKPLEDAILRLAEEHNVDVVVLAESNVILPELFHLAPGIRPSVQIYTREEGVVQSRFDQARFTIVRLRLPQRQSVLLAGVHLPSKLHWQDESQAVECEVLRREILDEETKFGHSRTIVVGDFNMNPFEIGMVKTTGLHSVMSRVEAKRRVRTVQGRDYQFFYNPMWNLMGDGARATAGSYHYGGSEHVSYFWNTFDQVLIRPDLIGGFKLDELQIVTKVAGRSLVKRDGRPDKTNFSDHLPIRFEIEF